ncbi:MAG TPA: hypothetical protein EYQ50_25670 [Verrucomicrobiales bacterium]|nr:hypothetical protein [Verrucomicrobiales bacterium]HIL72483.1 hypothetical protein [Verrucomicrobiota bacterium]
MNWIAHHSKDLRTKLYSRIRGESLTRTIGTNRSILGIHFVLLILASPELEAHHFKGLPHYNYFENYPQVPEEEFLGQAGNYELSLVVYDFQGIDRANVADPETVRLFLVVFQLRENRIYQGALTMEIWDRDQILDSTRFPQPDLEKVYSIHRKLPEQGRYSLRIILHNEKDMAVRIPFKLSSQKTHLGPWVATALFALFLITAAGARKKRVMIDRKENHQRAITEEKQTHA